MHSVQFSALSMHYPQCKTFPVRTRNCRLVYHGYKAVADYSWRKCRLLHHGYNAVVDYSWRKCRLLHHGYNAVADYSWRKCRLLHHGYNAVADYSWRKCRLLHHGYNAVADYSWLKCRLLHYGYNVVAMTLGPAAILCPGFYTGSWKKRSKRVKYCGSIHTLRPPPDQGGDVCKMWLRSVQKCGFV